MMMNTTRPPFTPSQWQELEHQALIFKYLMAGIPVPPDLVLPIRRSLVFHHQSMNWGCFQMGFGRKPDPEPGRCRRTDGKKWRCSKHAFPDSKYCERHMHRGRNRSRKHVETLSSSSSSATSSNSATSYSSSSASSSSSSNPCSYLMVPNHQNNPVHYFHYPHSSSSRPDIGLSSQNSSTHFQLGSGSYSSADKDYRYFHGLKDDVDEHIFFSEASGTARSMVNSSMDNNPCRLMPLRMCSLAQSNSKPNCSVLQSNYSQLQSIQDLSKQQYCFLGTDLRSEQPVKLEREQEGQHLRHFFDDWPPKTRDSWSDLDDDRSNHTSFSTTQLSISIPMASSEFSAANSRSNNDD